MQHQKRKTTKETPFRCGQKYVEMYSSFNIHYIHYKVNSLIQETPVQKKKIEQTWRLTDLKWPKYPAQNLHTPNTSHNNPQTSSSCRQNNNFWLIYLNVRNYSFAQFVTIQPEIIEGCFCDEGGGHGECIFSRRKHSFKKFTWFIITSFWVFSTM